MINESKVYVIGLTPFELLNIQYSNMYSKDGYITVIHKVIHGIENIRRATQIPCIEDAKELLQEIKDNKNFINFMPTTILESVIHGNNIDVDKLHIYEVEIMLTREVK